MLMQDGVTHPKYFKSRQHFLFIDPKFQAFHIAHKVDKKTLHSSFFRSNKW